MCLKTCFPWKPCYFDTEDYEKPFGFLGTVCSHQTQVSSFTSDFTRSYGWDDGRSVLSFVFPDFWLKLSQQKNTKKENPSNIRYPVWARNFQKSRFKPGVLGMFSMWTGKAWTDCGKLAWFRHVFGIVISSMASPIGPGVRLLNSMASMEVSADSISYNAAMAACSSLWQQAHPADDEKSSKVLIHVDTLWFIGGKSIVNWLITNLYPIAKLVNIKPNNYLVGGLEHLLWLSIYGIITPSDFQIFHRGRYTTDHFSPSFPGNLIGKSTQLQPIFGVSSLPPVRHPLLKGNVTVTPYW